MAGKIFDHLKEKIFREDILNRRHRPDGRRFNQIRPISIEIGWLPRAHGSALFTRGETQAIVTATLGTSEDIQYMDDLEKGGNQTPLPPRIQLPPFLSWRNRTYGLNEPARVRPRGARSPGARAAASRRSRLALHHARRFGYYRIQRFPVRWHRCAGARSH